MKNTLYPEIKSIISTEYDYGALPEDLEDGEVSIDVEIGIKGQEGADIFYLTAITPKAISGRPEKKWGRGYLIMPSFSWKEVNSSLEKLLMHCSGEDWKEISTKLSKELLWEYDNYKP